MKDKLRYVGKINNVFYSLYEAEHTGAAVCIDKCNMFRYECSSEYVTCIKILNKLLKHKKIKDLDLTRIYFRIEGYNTSIYKVKYLLNQINHGND